VQHFKMWTNSIRNVGIPKHLTVLIWDIHTVQSQSAG
jgi:hypothetical protein